jgi:hypothetical protein
VNLKFDLSGRLVLAVRGAGTGLERAVRRQLDPFEPRAGDGEVADVTVEFAAPRHALVELQNPARDGLVTGSDGERPAVVVDGQVCMIADPLQERPACFTAEPGFPVGAAFRTLVRPALQLALLGRGAAAVHAAAVEVDGAAVLVAGWSESGKTETALALMEDGAQFLTDKWTIVGRDGLASAFPIGVGVRRWVLPALPRLRAALPRTARAQLGVAAAADVLTRPVRRGTSGGAVLPHARRIMERAIMLADRAGLSPTQLRAAYGQTDDPARRVPLRAVAVLETVPAGEPTAHETDAAQAITRLARSAAYERRAWFGLIERAGYALPERSIDALLRSVEQERALLEAALAGVRVIRLRAPFPTDPRPVADALSRCL